MGWLRSAWAQAFEWPIWTSLRLEPSKWPASGNVFGLAEYIAALALLLVVMIASDFKFRYRLAVVKRDLRKWSFWSALSIGLTLIFIDFWYQNALPVPILLSNANNIKALVGLVFIILVFRIIYVGVMRRPKFTKSNARQFFESTYHFVHQGNSDKLQIIAEELSSTVDTIVKTASKISTHGRNAQKIDIPPHQLYAHQILLLLGDERFCRIIVDKTPVFALVLFQELQKYPNNDFPVFQFSRNIGQEFIQNTTSSFYQEDSGYYSGLLGYDRPVTRIIFGSHKFIEKCASDGASPLEADYRTFFSFNSQQMDGFSRASLAFLESYLLETKGRPYAHSYALNRVFSAFEHSLGQLHTLNGTTDFYANDVYRKLGVTVSFIEKAIELIDKHADKPHHFRTRERNDRDIYDQVSNLIFEILLSTSAVSSPPWTTWSVQHNTVWSQIFGFHNNKTTRIIALKLRRLIYEEIRRMDEFVNFKGARIIGYCLNVIGINGTRSRKGINRDFYPLRAVTTSWMKANYSRILADHPKVAATCIQGSISYDSKNNRLIKTYSNETRKEPTRDYLDLLPRPPKVRRRNSDKDRVKNS